MSWNPALDPDIPVGDAVDAIETVVVARARDLGGFEVRRALPSTARQMVGPFIFFDQMGPAEFLTGQGIDVRPHPHIGLATVTYLMQGRIHHRDSLGTDQWIEPGAVNLMHAGLWHHPFRTDGRPRRVRPRKACSACKAGSRCRKTVKMTRRPFCTRPPADLPVMQAEGKEVRLILGQAWGAAAPVETPSEMFYADAVLAPNAAIPLPDNHEDRGAYVLTGEVTVAGETYGAGRMLIFRPGDAISLRAGGQGARLILLGGATMDGPRHIWWNFVASSRERIDAAKEAWRAGDWAHGRFQLPPDDDAEFIPAPDR